ncbi:MAG: decaprenyl-phosphate phosphoribosyltransferase [Ignavibacteriaceae bacterium]|nr:decaprenyl-phosphate phosphoribosyltransferase [Ignavibacteriaceae bacterium]
MFVEYLKLLRITQWIKNFFLFVPLVFSKHLFHPGYFETSLKGFIIFCFISSVVYIMNDIADVESDRLHPKKKFRPLASGKIQKKNAILIASGFSTFFIVMLVQSNLSFVYFAVGYLVLNIFYTFSLKHIVLLDIFSIAAGFMIRIAAGAVIINVELSSWLILTTLFLSLFLAVSKRRSELVQKTGESEFSSRKVLESYSINFLDQIATIAGAGVIVSYALYTVSSRTITIFRTENLIYSTVFVVYGIFRYMFIVMSNNKGENTSEDIVSDLPMIVNAILYSIFVILVVYHII